MHIHRWFILSLLINIPLAANSAASTDRINIKVRFDQTFYELKYTQREFSFKESGHSQVVRVKNCNRAKLNQVAATYQMLLKNHSAQPARARTPYDIDLVNSGARLFVARGSDLGTWLREMPKKVLYIQAGAQASCKK